MIHIAKLLDPTSAERATMSLPLECDCGYHKMILSGTKAEVTTALQHKCAGNTTSNVWSTCYEHARVFHSAADYNDHQQHIHSGHGQISLLD